MLKKDRRRGFTLLEMIVVIAIIAVLIALVAPLMTRYITTAKEMKYQAAAKQLCTAGQAYVAEEMLNGYANCVGALDGERYQFNQLTKYGNGIFYKMSYRIIKNKFIVFINMYWNSGKITYHCGDIIVINKFHIRCLLMHFRHNYIIYKHNYARNIYMRMIKSCRIKNTNYKKGTRE